MILNDSSSVIQFEKKIIPRIDLKKAGIIREIDDIGSHIVRINKKYYYSKLCTNRQMINELIGTYLCNMVGLDVVDYQIGKRKDEDFYNHYYALSEIFYQDQYFYSTVQDYYDMKPDDNIVFSKGLDRFHICDTCVLDLADNPDLINSVLKMTAVDIKMGQIDRHNYNVMLRLAMNGKVEMEKLFDFGGSYDDNPPYPEFVCYDNPFLIVRKNRISIMSLVKKYPQIQETAAILCDISMYDIIKDIEKRFNVQIEDKFISEYVRMDKKFNKTLRKMR